MVVTITPCLVVTDTHTISQELTQISMCFIKTDENMHTIGLFHLYILLCVFKLVL